MIISMVQKFINKHLFIVLIVKRILKIGEDVVIAEKPEGALELFEYDYESLNFWVMRWIVWQ